MRNRMPREIALQFESAAVRSAISAHAVWMIWLRSCGTYPPVRHPL